MTSKAFGLAQLGNAYADGALSNRNKIINGAMTIDQRNAGAAASISAYGYGLDRFGFQCFGGGVWTSQQSATAPNGFSSSVALTVTTADASIGSTDVYQIFQKIEGYNVADLGFGTASAQSVTISFWVRSSVTGTYSVSLQNGNFNRGYVSTITVDAANVWEKKTITVAGDTSGTWTTTNGIGLQLAIDLGSGSASNITAGSWQSVSTSSLRTSGSVNWIATNGATFYITGVQLEAGDTATPFEHRSFGQELALCQRYFELGTVAQAGAQMTSSLIGFGLTYAVSKRATPTVAFTNTLTLQGVVAGLAGSVQQSNVTNAYCTISRSGTQGAAFFVTGDGGFNAWTASAEL